MEKYLILFAVVVEDFGGIAKRAKNLKNIIMNKCPFHSSTSKEVIKINIQDGCPVKIPYLDLKNTPVSELSLVQRKQQYYYLLLTYLPIIMTIVSKIRKDFPYGLVIYADETAGHTYGNLATAITDDFKAKICLATREKDFLASSYLVHNAIGISIDVATELWAAAADWDSPELRRLLELIDAHRKQVYGKLAAQKRISSAMLQTVHISASMEKFIYSFLEEKDCCFLKSKVASYHKATLKTALCLTELHLQRTREIRPVFDSTVDGGIIHRYVNRSLSYLSPERLELKEGSLSEAMKGRPIDSSDGRIGCPGKKHIPEIWKWIESVSHKFSYAALE